MTSYDITSLENAVKAVVKTAGVTTKVYGNRPKNASPSETFAVVAFASRVDDLDTYGESTLEVSLFAKDNQSEKNGAKLQWMQNTLLTAMPTEIGKFLIDSNPVILPDASDDFGFHARSIIFDITLKI